MATPRDRPARPAMPVRQALPAGPAGSEDGHVPQLLVAEGAEAETRGTRMLNAALHVIAVGGSWLAGATVLGLVGGHIINRVCGRG